MNAYLAGVLVAGSALVGGCGSRSLSVANLTDTAVALRVEKTTADGQVWDWTGYELGPGAQLRHSVEMPAESGRVIARLRLADASPDEPATVLELRRGTATRIDVERLGDHVLLVLR